MKPISTAPRVETLVKYFQIEFKAHSSFILKHNFHILIAASQVSLQTTEKS